MARDMNIKTIFRKQCKNGFHWEEVETVPQRVQRYNKKNGTFKSLKDNLPGASPQTEALEWSRV